MENIIDRAISAGNLDSFVKAVMTAGLVDMLSGGGPFTVFAPNDEAFRKLSKSEVEELKDISELKTVLTYHIASKAMAADIAELKSLKTIEGHEIKIDASRWHLHRSIKANDANIVHVDIVANNGVIHIIDKVLFPREEPRVHVLSYLVKDYMVKELNTVPSESTVIDGAKVMAADINAEGYAIVLEGGKSVGIITERDIVNRVLAKNLDPSKVRVEEVMSSPLISVDPDDDLMKASEMMQERKVKKLIVMKDGIAYGIITANDIVRHLRDYVEKSVKDILRSTAYI